MKYKDDNKLDFSIETSAKTGFNAKNVIILFKKRFSLRLQKFFTKIIYYIRRKIQEHQATATHPRISNIQVQKRSSQQYVWIQIKSK